MIGRLVSIALTTIALSGAAYAGENPFPLVLPDASLVYQVDNVDLFILKTQPPSLHITAFGETRSSGWTSPQLAPRLPLVPPADGIWDFDFIAMPPASGTIVTPALAPITADVLWPSMPPDARGVRVHAATNSVEALLVDGAAVKSAPAVSDASYAEIGIELTEPVIVNKQPPTPKTSLLTAKLRLHNPWRSDLNLTAPTPCAIVQWQITMIDGRVVQEKPNEICVEMVARLRLDPDQTITEPLSIVLDSDAYESGAYSLVVSFWGAKANRDFRVEVVQ